MTILSRKKTVGARKVQGYTIFFYRIIKQIILFSINYCYTACIIQGPIAHFPTYLDRIKFDYTHRWSKTVCSNIIASKCIERSIENN